MDTKLNELKELLKVKEKYDRAVTLFSWDMQTITPEKGFKGHADALAYFSMQSFKIQNSDKMNSLLTELSNDNVYNKLDDTWKFIVKRMKRDIDKTRNIPEEFYEEYVRAQTESGNAWKKAKRESDFSIFAPYLEKMISLTKKKAEYTDPGKEVYDVLLDQYEEGINSEEIDGLFEDIKRELIPLLNKVMEAEQPDDSIFKGRYDINAQKQVQKLLLEYIGFSFEKGAVGETEHPFTINFSSKDVRVTNHYYEDNAINAMFSAIHEGGHGIFEQNVNPDFDCTVAGSCSYMGIHESQSRFYENILGKNINFWIPIYEKVQDLLPTLKNISLEQFYHEINHVRKSLIRIDADELSYGFHIIVRYELEKAIFRDNVSVDELPELWNKKMNEYLQITPEKDAEGILQDTHWGDGSFGYFPTYLLGSIYDGMYLETIEKKMGCVDNILKEGNIKSITKWLNTNIHQYGNTRLPKEVIKNVCGCNITAKPLIEHFTKKYTQLYKL